MRRKPIARSELRVIRGQVVTAPANATKDARDRWDRRGRELPPALWQPVLRALQRELGKKPVMPLRWSWMTKVCGQCNTEFYHAHGLATRYCSDTCATAARADTRAKQVKRVSDNRSLDRINRRCPVCGDEIKAQRSTKRYCSDAHRYAARHHQEETPVT